MYTCRYCLEEGTTGYVAPCACSGTHKWVHETCLMRWRRNGSTRCEVCGHRFLNDVIGSLMTRKFQEGLHRRKVLASLKRFLVVSTAPIVACDLTPCESEKTAHAAAKLAALGVETRRFRGGTEREPLGLIICDIDVPDVEPWTCDSLGKAYLGTLPSIVHCASFLKGHKATALLFTGVAVLDDVNDWTLQRARTIADLTPGPRLRDDVFM